MDQLNELTQLLPSIISKPKLHIKWLNTLSYLENCGARKIAACEHPIFVKEEMLKHASEEFRHAHHLKKQMRKVDPTLSIPEDYSLESILGGRESLHYLNYLDAKACLYLCKEVQLTKPKIKEYAYLLVTYAIELRADILYPIYDEILRQYHSKVMVKSILLEEKEHLQEMKDGIAKLENGALHAKRICQIEEEIYCKWIQGIRHQIRTFDALH